MHRFITLKCCFVCNHSRFHWSFRSKPHGLSNKSQAHYTSFTIAQHDCICLGTCALIKGTKWFGTYKKVWQKRLWVHIIVFIGDSEMYTNLPTTFLELKSDTNSADSLKGSWTLWAGPKLHWVRKYGSLLEKGFLKLHLATFENTTHVQSYCL